MSYRAVKNEKFQGLWDQLFYKGLELEMSSEKKKKKISISIHCTSEHTFYVKKKDLDET